MKKGRIYIITGMIRSGKTTALKNWVESRDDICGILTPDINRERSFVHYPEKIIPMLCEPGNPDAISIGKYHFLRKNFEEVNELLIDDFNLSEKAFVLIDEIGPLEIAGQGMDKSFRYILERLESSNKKLIIVVREKMVGKIVKTYGINKATIVLKEGLNKID